MFVFPCLFEVLNELLLSRRWLTNLLRVRIIGGSAGFPGGFPVVRDSVCSERSRAERIAALVSTDKQDFVSGETKIVRSNLPRELQQRADAGGAADPGSEGASPSPSSG